MKHDSFKNFLFEGGLKIPEFEKVGNKFKVNLKTADRKFIKLLLKYLQQKIKEIAEIEFNDIIDSMELEDDFSFDKRIFKSNVKQWLKNEFSPEILESEYLPDEITLKKNPSSLEYNELAILCSEEISKIYAFDDDARNIFDDLAGF